VPPDGHSGGDGDVGPNPAFVLNQDGARRNGLVADGQPDVFVAMIQPRQHHVLRHNNVGANTYRANQYCANTDQAVRSNNHRANAVVDNAEVVDDAALAQFKRTKRQHV